MPVFPHIPEARPAAVLVPVMLAGGEARVGLIERSGKLRDHAGELAFPGGKPEDGDADLWATATREASEEVGISPERLEPLGALGVVPVVTGKYLVHSFAALLDGERTGALSGEIVRWIEVPLGPWLRGDRRVAANMNTWRGATFPSPFFHLDEGVLYGASAAIFFDLLARVAVAAGLPPPQPEFAEGPPWGNRYRAFEG